MAFQIKEKLHQLLTQNASPHSVALGSAIGMFFGFFPFFPIFGLKTLISYLLTLRLRANTIAAIIAITLHDILFFLAPVIYRVDFQIGKWLLSHPHHFEPRMKLSTIRETVFHWKTFVKIGVPTLLGSFILAVAAAGVFYLIVYVVMSLRQRRLAKKAPVVEFTPDI